MFYSVFKAGRAGHTPNVTIKRGHFFGFFSAFRPVRLLGFTTNVDFAYDI